MVTICIAYFYQWAAILDFKMADLHYMVASRSTFVVILGSNDLILVCGGGGGSSSCCSGRCRGADANANVPLCHSRLSV